jgi:hypothetical protein
VSDISRNASSLRQDWHEVYAFEARVRSEGSPAETVMQYLDIQESFFEQLQQTDSLFHGDRVRSLLRLQGALARWPGTWSDGP